ncbi:MAG: hypothetical protein ACLQU3_23415 [Limisphaerales bacterium]
MKVFLRLGRAGLYYAARKYWVPDRERALDLKTIRLATDSGRDEDLDSMVIVVSSGDPSSDWFLPLPRRQSVRSQAAPTSVQAPLPKAA